MGLGDTRESGALGWLRAVVEPERHGWGQERLRTWRRLQPGHEEVDIVREVPSSLAQLELIPQVTS